MLMESRMKWNRFWVAIVFGTTFWACSGDKTAGTSEESEGIYAVKNLDVAGLAQKGPFVKGSAVTVQGVDCKTMKFTDEEFTGKVKSDKGDFGVDDVNLSASCALFEVSGYYMNEVTGKKSSDKLTLHAITDLKDRKSVNINVLTELEYERVMNLVSKNKMSFANAKLLAEEEVLASLGVMNLFESFEGLNIYEKGDGNATLLATSVLLQSDLDTKKLADRIDNFASSIAETGEWNDDKAKTKMADWASTAKADGKFDSVRENLEKWSGSDKIPGFEEVVEEFGGAQKIPEEWSWDVPKEARLNPKIKYDSMVDPRDKKVYKVVKIEVPDSNYSQVWMAENLNYADSVKTPSLKGRNWCYNNEEKNCKVGGRYYSWAAAIDSVALAKDSKEPLNCGYGKKCGLDRAVQGICPDGWHLPSIYEWGLLSVALGSGGVAGEPLKALTGWDYAGTDDNNGTDLYGFAALPTGRKISATSWQKVGSDVYYWSATEYSADQGRYLNINNIYTNSYIYQNSKSYGQSVRCVKGDPSKAPVRPSSSSSVTSVSSSSSAKIDSTGWSWDVPKEARLNPKIKYDSMIDPRDKKVYKVVKIEVPDSNYSQVWMAENLNYADSVKTPSLKGGNWCYNNEEKNCKVGGRYYTWAAAIDSVALANDAKAPLDCGYGKKCGLDRAVQGICPNGWHLPSIYEWGLLSVALGSGGVAGEPLKALTGWDYAGTDDNNGTDLYGFAALPTGRKISATSWQKVGSDVYYWSATEYSADQGRYLNINNIYTNSYIYQNSKSYGQSVRCVKGDPSTAPVRPSSSSSVDETKSSSSSAKSSSSAVVSSSSQAKSSSSAVVSSSSVASSSSTLVSSSSSENHDSFGFDWSLPKQSFFNPNIEYDSIVDTRDGQTYKTVKIGNKVWMAENLNYYDEKDLSVKEKSWCFGKKDNKDTSTCDVAGRLYTWAAAIDSVRLATDSIHPLDCGYGKNRCNLTDTVQGVCPAGWHMPSKNEWESLFGAVGGQGAAGKVLKSQRGWYDNDNGTDAFGFTALPAGYRHYGGDFVRDGYTTDFWSSTEASGDNAYYISLNYSFNIANLYTGQRNYGYSVRCVKD